MPSIDLEGSEKTVFRKSFKIQMALIGFGRLWKQFFFFNPTGTDKVWKALKASCLQNLWNPNGPDSIWEAMKTSFPQLLWNPNGPDRIWKALATSFWRNLIFVYEFQSSFEFLLKSIEFDFCEFHSVLWIIINFMNFQELLWISNDFRNSMECYRI